MTKAIDAAEKNSDTLLLSRGLSSRLLLARIEEVPDKLRGILDLEGAYLHGGPGTGKTFLLCALMRKYITDGIITAREKNTRPDLSRLPYFANVNDLVQRLRLASCGQGEQGENEQTILDFYSTQPRLILDDIGTRRKTEFSDDMLYALIDARWSRMLQTFFTSNFDLKQLAGRIEARTVSRISEIVGSSIIQLRGRDRRFKNSNL